jgi:predicted RNA-binding protein with TRAM domain
MDFERRGYGSGRRGFHSGGGQESTFSQREAPVKVGDELDVTIEETSRRGDGIARVQGFVIFVAGAAKGEQCKVAIRDVRNRFAIGEKVG